MCRDLPLHVWVFRRCSWQNCNLAQARLITCDLQLHSPPQAGIVEVFSEKFFEFPDWVASDGIFKLDWKLDWKWKFVGTGVGTGGAFRELLGRAALLSHSWVARFCWLRWDGGYTCLEGYDIFHVLHGDAFFIWFMNVLYPAIANGKRHEVW